MTKDEAVDVLAQCALLRMSIVELEEKARAALHKPELRVVSDRGSDISPALRDEDAG